MKFRQSKFDNIKIVAAYNSEILVKKIKEMAEIVTIIDMQYSVTHDNKQTLLYTALILYKDKLA